MNTKQELSYEVAKALNVDGEFVKRINDSLAIENEYIKNISLYALSNPVDPRINFEPYAFFNGQQLGRFGENILAQLLVDINGFKFAHFKEDQKHKDFTCVYVPEVLPESLQKVLDKFHKENPDIDVTTPDFFSQELKFKQDYNNVVGNKALFKNEQNKKEQNSFYICVNYIINTDNVYPQIENVQIRFMYIDKEMWSWSSSGSGATVTFSKFQDRIVGLYDARKYTKRTERYRLEVHPDFK